MKKVLLGGAKIYSDFPVKRKVTIISFTCRCVFMQKNVVNTPFFRRKVCHRTYFSYKKSRQKNFPPNTPLYFGEAFEIPKDFSRKVLWSGFGAKAPTFSAHIKSTALPCFLKYPCCFLSSEKCFEKFFHIISVVGAAELSYGVHGEHGVS